MYLPKIFITQGNFAPIGAGYVVTEANGTLTNERILATGTNIVFDDAGPGGLLRIHVTGVTGSSPVDTGVLAPNNAGYLLITSHGALGTARLLELGENLVGYDAGAGGNYRIAVTGIPTGTSPGGGLTFGEAMRIASLRI